MSQALGYPDCPNHGDVFETAYRMAEELRRGFRAHDRGDHDAALEAFSFVDERQLQHRAAADIELAAEAFLEALRAKDDVELRYLRDGEFDADGIQTADYSRVRQKLRQRATVIGADPEYAVTKAEAWRQHKAGGDYWTPFQRSQVYELRAILEDPEYPRKPRGGQSGPGPEPLRYVLAFELHDMKTENHWRQGIRAMIPYFFNILEHHAEG